MQHNLFFNQSINSSYRNISSPWVERLGVGALDWCVPVPRRRQRSGAGSRHRAMPRDEASRP
ncbi:hypothetical protein I2I11_11710 [Pontibacter sp. 172403-2]|uniref:hypothetical protein n=1 Tax=Pontibacter rufus TaxID=2791028 RepID=UPI0018AF6CBA|nr:hypothetical protein [Pontibacter sp. 172403-2]MBF9253960.1 hypothetical protein [Pontibacter sp. 172403-2]